MIKETPFASLKQTILFYVVIVFVMTAIGVFSIAPTLSKVKRQEGVRQGIEKDVSALREKNDDLRNRYDAADKNFRIAQLLIERYGYRFKD